MIILSSSAKNGYFEKIIAEKSTVPFPQHIERKLFLCLNNFWIFFYKSMVWKTQTNPSIDWSLRNDGDNMKITEVKTATDCKVSVSPSNTWKREKTQKEQNNQQSWLLRSSFRRASDGKTRIWSFGCFKLGKQLKALQQTDTRKMALMSFPLENINFQSTFYKSMIWKFTKRVRIADKFPNLIKQPEQTALKNGGIQNWPHNFAFFQKRHLKFKCFNSEMFYKSILCKFMKTLQLYLIYAILLSSLRKRCLEMAAIGSGCVIWPILNTAIPQQMKQLFPLSLFPSLSRANLAHTRWCCGELWESIHQLDNMQSCPSMQEKSSFE